MLLMRQRCLLRQRWPLIGLLAFSAAIYLSACFQPALLDVGIDHVEESFISGIAGGEAFGEIGRDIDRAVARRPHPPEQGDTVGRKAAEVEKDELVALLYAARGETAEALRVAQLAVEAEALMVPSGPPDDFKPAQ